MRILTLHADYFGDLWRALGHEVVTCNDRLDATLPLAGHFVTVDEILSTLGPARTPDLIFWGDESRGVRVLGLEGCAIPKVMYSVDTHLHADWHPLYARIFDLVFVAQKDYLDAFNGTSVLAEWLPLYGRHVDEVWPGTRKIHDVSFVGTLDPHRHRERIRFLEEVSRRVPLNVARGDYGDVYSHSRIVLNHTVRSDLNFRVFEALVCGSLLVTERTGNGLLDLFTEGEHLVTYERGNADDAAVVIRRYLTDTGAASRIGQAGRQEVRRRHLRAHRAAFLLERFEELIEPGRVRPAVDTDAVALTQSLLYRRLYRRAAARRIRYEEDSSGSEHAPRLVQSARVLEDGYLELSRRYRELSPSAG